MAKNIKLGKIGEHLEDQVEKLLRVTVLTADRRVKEASPVKTGRFKVSWQVGENSSEGEPKPPGEYGTGITPISAVNYRPGNEKVGNYYSVHNNLPYADKLANAPLGEGSSVQTNGPGWLDLIGKDLQSYVRSEYEKIKRQG